ncbi:Mitogen-activated protein kinase 15-1 MPK15-1 [Gracilaria domingensis]|nr:Mitogen-activated protein kinase 15-1 MPK15-1 [Gracilaria domingensis]
MLSVASGEQRLAAPKNLSKDTSHRPHVNSGGIYVGIDENVTGVQIAVKHASRVQEVDGAQQLKHDILDVPGAELGLTAQQTTEIGGHELEDDEHVVEAVALTRDEHVLDGDDVLVFVQKAQKLELAQDAGGHAGGVEHALDALDSDALPLDLVERGHDDAVGALADDLLNDVARGLHGGREEAAQNGLAAGAPVARRRHGGSGRSGGHQKDDG